MAHLRVAWLDLSLSSTEPGPGGCRTLNTTQLRFRSTLIAVCHMGLWNLPGPVIPVPACLLLSCSWPCGPCWSSRSQFRQTGPWTLFSHFSGISSLCFVWFKLYFLDLPPYLSVEKQMPTHVP